MVALVEGRRHGGSCRGSTPSASCYASRCVDVDPKSHCQPSSFAQARHNLPMGLIVIAGPCLFISWVRSFAKLPRSTSYSSVNRRRREKVPRHRGAKCNMMALRPLLLIRIPRLTTDVSGAVLHSAGGVRCTW